MSSNGNNTIVTPTPRNVHGSSTTVATPSQSNPVPTGSTPTTQGKSDSDILKSLISSRLLQLVREWLESQDAALALPIAQTVLTYRNDYMTQCQKSAGIHKMDEGGYLSLIHI